MSVRSSVQSVHLEKGHTLFMVLRVKRVFDGVEIYVKSPQIEDYCKSAHELMRQRVQSGAVYANYSYGSTEDAETFLINSESVTSVNPFYGKKGYQLESGSLPPELRGMANWGHEQLFQDRGGDYAPTLTGLAIFAVVGVGEGVSFKFKGMYRAEALQKFTRSVRDAMAKFYADLLRPVDIEVVLTVKEAISEGSNAS